jgi:hypothetical protein
MRQTLSAALFVLLIPAAAFAQTAAPPPAVPFDQVLSANPLGVVVKWFNVEYERKLGTAATFGASASHFGELDFSNAAVLVRWYPQQSPLDGFYLGARAGAFGFKTFTYEVRPYRERNIILPGAGVELGHNWLLGPRHNVSLGTGFGLTRIATGSDSYHLPSVLPSFRLNVGIAF